MAQGMAWNINDFQPDAQRQRQAVTTLQGVGAGGNRFRRWPPHGNAGPFLDQGIDTVDVIPVMMSDQNAGKRQTVTGQKRLHRRGLAGVYDYGDAGVMQAPDIIVVEGGYRGDCKIWHGANSLGKGFTIGRDRKS